MAPDDLEPCRAAAVAAALDAIGARGWNRPGVLEAYAALERDPGDIVGAFTVPAADPEDPKHGLRPLSAAARTGYDPTQYPDPERGPTDLAEMLQRRTDAAEGSDDDSVVAFTILGLHGAGRGVEATMLADHLMTLQGDDGGWRCGQPRATPDCTGFAVQALTAAGALDAATADRAAGFVETMRQEDGGYGFDAQWNESNGDSTAWALTTLQLAGREPDVEPWRYLLGLQTGGGGFSWRDGEPPGQGTTAAAIVALAGGSPGPAYTDIEVEAPEDATPGAEIVLETPGADRAVWLLDGQEVQGTSVRWTLGEEDLDVRVEAWSGQGVHRQAFTVRAAGTDAEAPLPWALPLLALAAVVPAARRWHGRPGPPPSRTGPRW